MTSQYKVLMHFDLEDELDKRLSPMDGIQAIGDVHLGLPRVHKPRRLLWPFQSHLPLYYARLEWAGLGVTYVQLGNELHVIHVWDEAQHLSFARRAIVIPECPDAIRECNPQINEEGAYVSF